MKPLRGGEVLKGELERTPRWLGTHTAGTVHRLQESWAPVGSVAMAEAADALKQSSLHVLYQLQWGGSCEGLTSSFIGAPDSSGRGMREGRAQESKCGWAGRGGHRTVSEEEGGPPFCLFSSSLISSLLASKESKLNLVQF